MCALYLPVNDFCVGHSLHRCWYCDELKSHITLCVQVFVFFAYDRWCCPTTSSCMDVEEFAFLVSSVVLAIQIAVANMDDKRHRLEESDRLFLECSGARQFGAYDFGLYLNGVALQQLQCLLSMSESHDSDRWWVKSRSITWFEQFVLTEYDDHRWIELFRMSKATVLRISDHIHPLIGKQDTNFRGCVPTRTRVAGALFKLAHNSHHVVVTELFGLGRAIVGTILQEVVGVINIVFGTLIRWPEGEDMEDVVSDFRAISQMPSVHGAIDCTHITISKPKVCPEDYFYYKQGAYTIVLQAVVDAQKRFTDIFVGLPGSVNDSCILKKSGLYRRVLNGGLLSDELHHTADIPPYILGDKGYPLLPWLLTPFRDDGRQRTVLETVYQEYQSRGRSVVENAFGILKQTWRELLVKTSLRVEFIPDVVTCCCVLHNMILGTAAPDIDYLRSVLAEEARLDNLDPRRLGARGRVLHRPHAALCREIEDGEGIQRRANVVAYLGNIPQRQ
jgi:hypothetical protein